MQEQLDMLKTIKDNDQLRKEFELFLKDVSNKIRNFKDEGVDYSQRDIFFKGISIDINNKMKELHRLYSVDIEALKLFFSMDKRICDLAWYRFDESIKKELILDSRASLKSYEVKLSGAKLQDEFNYPRGDGIKKFLIRIKDILPDSSKKYITSKVPVRTEVWNAEKIVNEFQKKVFISELSDKPEGARLKALLTKFNKLKSSSDKILSLHYFHAALCDKYNSPNVRGTKTIKDKIITNYFHLFNIEFNRYGVDRESNQVLVDLKKAQMKDTETTSNLLSFCIYKGCSADMIFYLFGCCRTEENREVVKDFVFNRLDLRADDIASFNGFSSELKNEMFSQIESQRFNGRDC